MRGLLLQLEQSALGEIVRTSSLWTYPIVNLLHIFGISTLFGAAVIVDLRLMGVWPRVPIGSVARIAVPMAKTGFVLAASTGVALLAATATEYVGNPFFLIKFAAIAVGLVNVAVLNAAPAWKAARERELLPEERRRLAAYGAVSLLAWTTAVSAGRLIAYW